MFEVVTTAAKSLSASPQGKQMHVELLETSMRLLNAWSPKHRFGLLFNEGVFAARQKLCIIK